MSQSIEEKNKLKMYTLELMGRITIFSTDEIISFVWQSTLPNLMPKYVSSYQLNIKSSLFLGIYVLYINVVT